MQCSAPIGQIRRLMQQTVEPQTVHIQRIRSQLTGQFTELLLDFFGTRTSNTRSINASIENRWALMFSRSGNGLLDAIT
jgi:hypothetical protein